MPEYTDLDPDQQLMLCLTCGAGVIDQAQHNEWHQRHGDPEDLSHFGGANDPGPMPPREG